MANSNGRPIKEPANPQGRCPDKRENGSHLTEYAWLLPEIGGVESARVEAVLKELRALPPDVQEKVAERLVQQQSQTDGPKQFLRLPATCVL